MIEITDERVAEMCDLAEELIRFDTTGGTEAPAATWFRTRLSELGFETYAWEADPEELASLVEFPPASELDVENRPSVAGVLEFGDPDAGPTLVLNGHLDVVPPGGEWSGDAFEPRWEGNRLVGRGAVDMKSQVAACVFAALAVEDALRNGTPDLDGRIVVEAVAGEEEGGIGAPAAALSSPYPFERDAAIVAEPTDFRVVTATAGCLMARLRVPGQPAHAARRWQGEDPLDRFEAIRAAFRNLEADRATAVTHSLFERFDVPWPVVMGRVSAGEWASNVPGDLTAEARLGVAPGESLDAVERAFRERLEAAVAGDEWLAANPPDFERFGVQFEPAEVDPREPVVGALQGALAERGRDPDPTGETYGSDARHYVRAGIPTVVFGPGRIEEAHFPEESIRWPRVLEAAGVIADAAWRFLGRDSR